VKMTSDQNFNRTLVNLVSDLSMELPAAERYQHLLEEMAAIFPFDSAAILQLEGDYLRPLAVRGLLPESMGRRFRVEQHPRLSRLLHSRETVRFPADSSLPDPYDGLVENQGEKLHVHDCMGASLYIDNRPWGVLTLDAMAAGTFDQIDLMAFATFLRLTEATVKAAMRIDTLAARAEYEQRTSAALQAAQSEVAEIVGSSKVIETLRSEITTVAKSSLSVLVQGETGVGKELVARLVHAQSQRQKKPLVYVNCAALPEGVAESELFGHVKGAFSGAHAERSGKFEIADGGTLFLDEIGELPLNLQAKLLRVLQSGEIQRVGSDKHIEVDVRIVAATNRNLEQEIQRQQFRADLYHRLSVYPIEVPPLRERDDDVLLLAGYFLESNQHRFGVQGFRLSEAASTALQEYPWPGNVRELDHVLSRAGLKAMASQSHDGVIIIHAQHLDLSLVDMAMEVAGTLPDDALVSTERALLHSELDLKSAVDEFQRQLIRQRLKQFEGNRAAVARSLQMDRGNFHRLLKRLDLLVEQV